jgi:hypothetical protein
VFSIARHAWRRKRYLNVLNDAFVPKVSSGSVSCCGKGIGRNVEERAVATVGDVQGSHGDYASSAIRPKSDCLENVHRVWSRRYRAPVSPALLLTAPMPEDSYGCLLEKRQECFGDAQIALVAGVQALGHASVPNQGRQSLS